MANAWWELQIISHPDQEESIFWRLDCFGCRGTVREIQGEVYLIRAYIPHAQVNELDLAALSLWLRQDAQLLEFVLPETHWQVIEEEDWAASWKEHWHPQKIGDRLLILPAWLKAHPQEERLVLRLDPGVAFGTGEHATTQLCLESLEMRFSLPQKDLTLVDIGCGSGILTIAAILLGAKQVYAMDIDPLSVQAARENCFLNRLTPDQVVVKRGSIDQLGVLTQDPVDGILCNILAETIIELIPAMTRVAHPKTWAILSGILTSQTAEVSQVVTDHGWLVGTLWQQQEWCCFNIRRS